MKRWPSKLFLSLQLVPWQPLTESLCWCYLSTTVKSEVPNGTKYICINGHVLVTCMGPTLSSFLSIIHFAVPAESRQLNQPSCFQLAGPGISRLAGVEGVCRPLSSAKMPSLAKLILAGVDCITFVLCWPIPTLYTLEASLNSVLSSSANGEHGPSTWEEEQREKD